MVLRRLKTETLKEQLVMGICICTHVLVCTCALGLLSPLPLHLPF